MSSAEGCTGERAASNDAAGRLLNNTAAQAATAPVPQTSRCDSAIAGPTTHGPRFRRPLQHRTIR